MAPDGYVENQSVMVHASVNLGLLQLSSICYAIETNTRTHAQKWFTRYNMSHRSVGGQASTVVSRESPHPMHRGFN